MLYAVPLPLQPLDTALARYFLLVAGTPVPSRPTGKATLTGAPGESTSFFLQDKFTGALTFSGADFELLLAIENSSTPCQPIGLLLELRPHEHAPFAHKWQGVFTCREQGSVWDLDKGTFTVTPAIDSNYQRLLETWDTEHNLLSVPAARQTVTAELAQLSTRISLAFLRLDDRDDNSAYASAGYVTFLENHSVIPGPSIISGIGYTKEHMLLVFRYELRGVPMVPDGLGGYIPYNKAGDDWVADENSRDNTTPIPTITYYKSPTISGFKPYKLYSYGQWSTPPDFRHGNALLLLPCGETPAQYGFTGTYIEVTGPGGAHGPDNCPTCLNVRREVGETGADAHCMALFWKFGAIDATRCFPLLDGLYHLLKQTVMPWGGQSLLPPASALLSTFYSAATNPATGESGATNEVPGLVLSAASDVKRYRATEPATRLMISLKQLVYDLCALHDVGWFVDPETGWFRMEHRVFAETQHGAGPVVDLRAVPGALMPRSYTTLQAQLPRYEELTIASASTVGGTMVGDQVYETDFGRGLIDYGPASCANSRVGQNRTTVAATRLTGDIAAMILFGDAIPDNAVAILTRAATGQLLDANRALSASRLMRRYHRHQRAAASATVNGILTAMLSLRPQREQAAITMPLAALPALPDVARLTTSLGTEGRLVKRELDLLTGKHTLTIQLPIPVSATPASVSAGRQFSDSFSDSLG